MKRQIRGLSSWRLLPHWTISDLSREDASEPGLGSHLYSVVLTLGWLKFLLLLYSSRLGQLRMVLQRLTLLHPPLRAAVGGEIRSRKCKAATPFDHISSRCPRPGPHDSSPRCHHWGHSWASCSQFCSLTSPNNSQKLSQPNDDPESLFSWSTPGSSHVIVPIVPCQYSDFQRQHDVLCRNSSTSGELQVFIVTGK